MSTLYVVRAQPNPRGKDTVGQGRATNDKLNEEWVEFEAVGGDRSLTDDVIYNLTFTQNCAATGRAEVTRFLSGLLSAGQRLRLHTGRGISQTVSNVQHAYVGRDWFIWNNFCGDRVTVEYHGGVVDSAGWSPRAPEGILVRVPGTDRLLLGAGQSYGA